MHLLLAVLHTLCYLGLGLAIPLPWLRRPTAVALLLVAALGVALGLADPDTRELVTRHTFVGYEQSANETSPVHFPTGTERAPGWSWPLPFAAFAVAWAAALWFGSIRTGVLPPLLLAWTATATWLGMQKLAAPEALVQPFGLDRILWPAGLALALQLGKSARSLREVLLYTCLGVVAARLPAAVFSKLASDLRLGTSLDVTDVVQFVHPITQLQFQPPLRPGDPEQQFWLIWAEHVFVFPAFYLMSLFGVALGAFMWHRHSGDPLADAPRRPAPR